MSNGKEYDFVVYGATGFTGKLVVEYLVEKYCNDSEVTWALAGRNHEKLKSVAQSIGVPKNTELLVVDSNDVATIESLVSKTKCVLTTVGPYQLYGDDIVAACAKSGTDYVDLCGEPGWMHEKINELGESSTILNRDFMIACKDGAILPILIQREGKKVVSLDDFLRGFTFAIQDELNV